MNLSQRLFVLLGLAIIECHTAFLVSPSSRHTSTKGPVELLRSSIPGPLTVLGASTPQKPLYDGTNYTFPDTTSPEGIAEVLEVSFVHACMQLRSGFVDVLKMFIATAMSSYQFGFDVDEIQRALLDCPKETANRPLLSEEVDLRNTWLSLVYLTLLTMDHPTIRKEIAADSIPKKVRERYGLMVEKAVEIHKQDELATITVEELLNDKSVASSIKDLSEMERAILMQSLRVATLTLVVVREALEAGPTGGQSPPIEGAFG